MTDSKTLDLGPKIDRIEVQVFTIPTDVPEADGTIEWSDTTLVLVRIQAGGKTGLGYTYADKGAATVIQDKLAEVIRNQDAFAIGHLWAQLSRSIRNIGPSGIASMAVAAVDTALWDLKARLLNMPLVRLLGPVRDEVPVYGSGGFLTYSEERLHDQMQSWAAEGLCFVKMKIGADLSTEQRRISLVRQFIDANGALTPRQAILFCQTVCKEYQVSWFEEPVSSQNLSGLQHIRNHAAPQTDIAAGEYGYDSVYFRKMLEHESVDVLQADATRCRGYSGFLQADVLCAAFEVPLSAHTAPALHVPVCCAAQSLCHLEYFHDHVRIEKMLFDGLPTLVNGCLKPDLSRPGHGLEFKDKTARKYAV
jgi:L-alanine-DL-glutamate epimerase-like enolase superfamily enzyme